TLVPRCGYSPRLKRSVRPRGAQKTALELVARSGTAGSSPLRAPMSERGVQFDAMIRTEAFQAAALRRPRCEEDSPCLGRLLLARTVDGVVRLLGLGRDDHVARHDVPRGNRRRIDVLGDDFDHDVAIGEKADRYRLSVAVLDDDQIADMLLAHR